MAAKNGMLKTVAVVLALLGIVAAGIVAWKDVESCAVANGVQIAQHDRWILDQTKTMMDIKESLAEIKVMQTVNYARLERIENRLDER